VGSFDTITWQALTVILTLSGLAGTVLFWRLRGPVAGLRMLAVALLPAAAYLTGTMRLFWEIGDAVVSWALRLTFSPSMWLGVSIAVVAVAIFSVAGMLRRRGVGRPAQAAEKALPGTSSRESAKPPRTTAAPKAKSKAASKSGAQSGDDDMADIEAILKKHGIT
jgi:hypothetical protein